MTIFQNKNILLIAVLLGLSGVASAEELNGGDTAWILTSTALVLFMTIPGLALFYAGLVRSKNVLSVLMQCFAITCVATVLWLLFGYSLSFADGGTLNQWIGGLSNTFLSGVTRDSMSGTIPTSVWVMFQLTFAVITPALVIGGFAERMRFSAMLWFTIFWSALVYFPGMSLGLGRRLARRQRYIRFCWWFGCSHHRRSGRFSRCNYARHTQRLPQHSLTSA